MSYRRLWWLLVLLVTAGPAGCPSNNLQPWSRYAQLYSEPIYSQPWLIIKCRTSDVPPTDFLPGPPNSGPNPTVSLPPAIPDLDTYIDMFLTFKGAGTGNLTDYYDDVTYGAVSVDGNFVVGWYTAPFKKTDPVSKQDVVEQCATAALKTDPVEIGARLASSWGIIAVVNVVMNNASSCYVGQEPLTIDGQSYNLGCISFDPLSFFTQFAAHEVGHGLGLPHAFDNSTINGCGLPQGDYMDSYDVMGGCTPPQTHFLWPNYPGENNYINIGSGPGLTVPSLLYLKALPLPGALGSPNSGVFWFLAGDRSQTVVLTALSHPIVATSSSGPWLAAVMVGSNPNDVYTVEYRQQDGWDQGIPRTGEVLIHEYVVPAAPVTNPSTPVGILQRSGNTSDGQSDGGWLAGNSWKNPQGGTVKIQSIDSTNATATIEISSQ